MEMKKYKLGDIVALNRNLEKIEEANKVYILVEARGDE